jgi:hypothetical protein
MDQSLFLFYSNLLTFSSMTGALVNSVKAELILRPKSAKTITFYKKKKRFMYEIESDSEKETERKLLS